MNKLELKDWKILKELDDNARRSNSDIAKRVRLNKNTVSYKIRRLEEEGVVNGYYPVIDNSKLGYFSFRVYLKFFNLKAEQEEAMVKWLKDNNKVGVISKIESIYDLGFMIWVKSIYEFDDFWLEFKEKFRKHFWKERVDAFSKVYHFKRNYLLEKSSSDKYEVIGERNLVEHDELDIRILRILSKNARTPLVEISANLKKPPRTIAFRIRQMEKRKIIQGYRVDINLEKIGYEYYKIDMVLNDFYKYDEILNFCLNHTNIIYLDRTLSDLDFEIDIEIKNRKEMIKLLNEIKSVFNIRDIEILSFKEYHKLELLPS
ncbi:Lrp/AsnC family transcriptional regulator [Candidatus Pacearchaeota archaeon]|nr:Lrp/AsnC family transcriptional regulator [Candidatus Pacearchaeota archaeon]